MTFTEEGDSKHKSKLSLWRTEDDQLFLEMQEDTAEPDPYSYQSVTLDLDDARELMNEISRIITEVEREQVPEQQPRLLPTGTGNLFS